MPGALHGRLLLFETMTPLLITGATGFLGAAALEEAAHE